jgi:hypothetical protein
MRDVFQMAEQLERNGAKFLPYGSRQCAVSDKPAAEFGSDGYEHENFCQVHELRSAEKARPFSTPKMKAPCTCGPGPIRGFEKINTLRKIF